MGTLFSRENSAIDALTQEGFEAVTDRSIPHMLYLSEKGFGYRKMGKLTLYLWSFSIYKENMLLMVGLTRRLYRSSAAPLSW
jgi:lysozyme family protein